jgi:iron complex outermembrane receptor protein
MFVKTRLTQALLLAFGGTAAMWTAPVRAQDAGGSSATTQRVEVTGSAIRRTDAETPSPVQVITAAELKQTGFTSIQDVLHNITANGQGTLSQGFSGAFASGASGVSLRGLNVGATLVLIDGHRSAPFPIGDDGQRSFVDISSIPFDAVERIEVLKDGASALYGSDAIAGVVNIILKHSYTGVTLNADIGTSWKGDGTTRHLSGIWGMGDLAKDGHNFYLAVESRSQDQIRYSDRGGYFTKTDYRDLGGMDVTPGVPNDANGGLPRSGTGYVTDPDTGDTVGFMPGCDAAKQAAGQCTYRDTWSQIQPRTQNANFIGRFTMRDASNWQLTLDGSYFVSKAQQVGAPSRTFAAGFQGITSGPGVVPSLLPVVAPVITSSNPSFPADATASSGVLRYTFLDLGPTTTDTDSRTLRTVAQLDGRAGAWDLSASAGYSQVRLTVEGHDFVDPYNLATALQSTTDPYIVGGPNTSSVLDFIAPTLVSNDLSKLYFAHVGGSRDLMEMGGGAMALAVGADYLHRSQYAVAPAQVDAGHYTGLYSNNFTLGYQDVASAYAELSMPITKTLETDLQARYDHYNLSGSRTSPKLGVKWTPVKEYALRGTLSRGFRAPGPAENGTAGQTYFTGTTADDKLCGNHDPAGNIPDTQYPGNFPSECAVAVGTVQSTTKTLKPETSKSFTLGAIAEPIKGFSATLDYYWIQINNQIVTGGDRIDVRGTNFTPIPQVQPDGSLKLVVPPYAPIAYQTTGYVNANSTTTSGVDVDLTLKQRLGGWGDLTSDLQISYMNKYDLKLNGETYHLAGTHGPLVVGGDTGNPRTRLRWANTWSMGPAELTGTVNYIGSYSNIDPSDDYAQTCYDAVLNYGAAGTALENLSDLPAPVNACRTKAFTTFDLQGNYTVTRQFSVHGSILNLFNAKAPLDWATYGGGAAPYNPSLHAQGAIGRYFSVGGTYTF